MEHMQELIGAYGGPGLLLVSFIAATLVPLSSEVAMLGAMGLGMPAVEALVWASIGNCLGVSLNYALGRWGSSTILRRLMAGRAGRRAVDWTERYGKWTLLLSWVPIIGDPLTLAAGVLRVHVVFFVVVAFAVRIGRYALLAALG